MELISKAAVTGGVTVVVVTVFVAVDEDLLQDEQKVIRKIKPPAMMNDTIIFFMCPI